MQFGDESQSRPSALLFLKGFIPALSRRANAQEGIRAIRGGEVKKTEEGGSEETLI